MDENHAYVIRIWQGINKPIISVSFYSVTFIFDSYDLYTCIGKIIILFSILNIVNVIDRSILTSSVIDAEKNNVKHNL